MRGQHGLEDVQFEQVLVAFGSLAEHCLPSLTHSILRWHQKQNPNSLVHKSTLVKSKE